MTRPPDSVIAETLAVISPICRRCPAGVFLPGFVSASHRFGLSSRSSRISIFSFFPGRQAWRRAGKTRVSFATRKCSAPRTFGRSRNQRCSLFPVSRRISIKREPSRSSAGCWATSTLGKVKSKSASFTKEPPARIFQEKN